MLEGQLCSDNLVHCAAMGFSVSNELGQLLFGQGNVETDGHIPWVNVECLQGSIKKKKRKKKEEKGERKYPLQVDKRRFDRCNFLLGLAIVKVCARKVEDCWYVGIVIELFEGAFVLRHKTIKLTKKEEEERNAYDFDCFRVQAHLKVDVREVGPHIRAIGDDIAHLREDLLGSSKMATLGKERGHTVGGIGVAHVHLQRLHVHIKGKLLELRLLVLVAVESRQTVAYTAEGDKGVHVVVAAKALRVGLVLGTFGNLGLVHRQVDRRIHRLGLEDFLVAL